MRIATEKFSEAELDRLTDEVVEAAGKLRTTPTVEQIQDIVEEKLIESDYAKTAKAYILYRAEHQKLREMDDELVKIYSALTFVSAEDGPEAGKMPTSMRIPLWEPCSNTALREQRAFMISM